MKRNTAILPKDFQSSFLSCEKDCETIVRRLFLESQPYSNDLKRLLAINTKDCLDNKESEVYKNKINELTLKKLCENQYIKFAPKIRIPEHEDIKSYIIISFDNFAPNATNPEFRDNIINFDIICHTDYWDLGNFRQRPLKIAGYIDAILNNSKLFGIGELHFVGCNELVLSEDLSGYTLSYYAIHGSDDKIPKNEG
jgi:hypothetical protein